MINSKWFEALVVATFLLALGLLAWQWAAVIVWVFDVLLP